MAKKGEKKEKEKQKQTIHAMEGALGMNIYIVAFILRDSIDEI